MSETSEYKLNILAKGDFAHHAMLLPLTSIPKAKPSRSSPQSHKKRQQRSNSTTFSAHDERVRRRRRMNSNRRNMPCDEHSRIWYMCKECKEQTRHELMREYADLDEEDRNHKIWVQMGSFYCLQCVRRAIETETPLTMTSRDFENTAGLCMPLAGLGKCKILEHNGDAKRKHCNCPGESSKVWRTCIECIGKDPRAGLSICQECGKNKRSHAVGCSQKAEKQQNSRGAGRKQLGRPAASESDPGIESDDGTLLSKWRTEFAGEESGGISNEGDGNSDTASDDEDTKQELLRQQEPSPPSPVKEPAVEMGPPQPSPVKEIATELEPPQPSPVQPPAAELEPPQLSPLKEPAAELELPQPSPVKEPAVEMELQEQEEQEQQDKQQKPAEKRRIKRRHVFYPERSMARKRAEALRRNKPLQTKHVSTFTPFSATPLGKMRALRIRHNEEILALAEQRPSSSMCRSLEAAKILGGIDGTEVVNPEDIEWFSEATLAFAMALATGDPEDAANAVRLSDGIFALGKRRAGASTAARS